MYHPFRLFCGRKNNMRDIVLWFILLHNLQTLTIGQNLHKTCRQKNYACTNGTICDSAGMCKIPQNGTCTEDIACLAGAMCVGGNCMCTDTVSEAKGLLCDPEAGVVEGACSKKRPCHDENAECKEGKCSCVLGYMTNVMDLTCKRGVGGKCKRSTDCADGMTCENSTCRIMLGYPCSGSKKKCEGGTVCDDKERCSVDLQGRCEGLKAVFCKSGTVCDRLNLCGLGVGAKCKDSGGSCTAGSLCLNSVCVCANHTKVEGDVCKPLAGRAYGACLPSSHCSDPASSCTDDNVCECRAGYFTDHDFHCVPSFPQGSTSESNRSTIVTQVVLSVLGALLLIAAGVGTFLYHRRLKQYHEGKLSFDEHLYAPFKKSTTGVPPRQSVRHEIEPLPIVSDSLPESLEPPPPPPPPLFPHRPLSPALVIPAPPPTPESVGSVDEKDEKDDLTNLADLLELPDDEPAEKVMPAIMEDEISFLNAGCIKPKSDSMSSWLPSFTSNLQASVLPERNVSVTTFDRESTENEEA